jgi:hypothetical protein
MAKRTRKPDQLDLVDYIQEQQRPKEAYREIFRSVRLPDGRLQHFDYSHLPPEKRPLVWIEVQS